MSAGASAGMGNPYAALIMESYAAGFDTSYAFGSTIGQFSVNRQIASMLRNSYRSQARLTLLAAERQNAYLNQATAQANWNIASASRLFSGTQASARAAQGWIDTTSLDYNSQERDTARRSDKAIWGNNVTTYNQAFENERAARMEANRLEYAAKYQDYVRKQNSPLKGFISANFAALGALGSHAGNLSQSLSDYNFYSMGGTKNIAGPTSQLPSPSVLNEA